MEMHVCKIIYIGLVNHNINQYDIIENIEKNILDPNPKLKFRDELSQSNFQNFHPLIRN